MAWMDRDGRRPGVSASPELGMHNYSYCVPYLLMTIIGKIHSPEVNRSDVKNFAQRVPTYSGSRY